MGRSGALFMGICFTSVSVLQVMAQDAESRGFWDGFYLGILGGDRAQTAAAPGADAAGDAGMAGGAGQVANKAFYYGAEAFLAAQNVSGDDGPFLWLEADGRLGAQVTKQMLLYTSAGTGFDAGERQLALTRPAGAEMALNQGMAVRAQYSLAHYPEGGGAVHGGDAGVVFRRN